MEPLPGWPPLPSKKRKLRLGWSCSPYVYHCHRSAWAARLCGRAQRLLIRLGLMDTRHAWER